MRDCTRKLRQERGASAVFALVIFLIVTLFSFTMVNGALTAAQNASMQREEEQAYLSVTSAARLFCDMFKGGNVERTFSGLIPFEQYAGLPDPAQIWSLYWNQPGNVITDAPSVSDAQKLILDTFTAMVKVIDSNGNPLKQLSIAPDSGNASWPTDLGTVKVNLTMNAEYKVTAEFSRDPAPDSGNLQYYVSVTLKCTKEEPAIDVSADPISVSKTLIWTVESVERGRYS